MKSRPRPLLGVRYEFMLHWIEMNVIIVAFHVQLISYSVFPKSSLEKRGFTFSKAGWSLYSVFTPLLKKFS